MLIQKVMLLYITVVCLSCAVCAMEEGSLQQINNKNKLFAIPQEIWNNPKTTYCWLVVVPVELRNYIASFLDDWPDRENDEQFEKRIKQEKQRVLDIQESSLLHSIYTITHKNKTKTVIELKNDVRTLQDVVALDLSRKLIMTNAHNEKKYLHKTKIAWFENALYYANHCVLSSDKTMLAYVIEKKNNKYDLESCIHYDEIRSKKIKIVSLIDNKTTSYSLKKDAVFGCIHNLAVNNKGDTVVYADLINTIYVLNIKNKTIKEIGSKISFLPPQLAYNKQETKVAALDSVENKITMLSVNQQEPAKTFADYFAIHHVCADLNGQLDAIKNGTLEAWLSIRKKSKKKNHFFKKIFK